MAKFRRQLDVGINPTELNISKVKSSAQLARYKLKYDKKLKDASKPGGLFPLDAPGMPFLPAEGCFMQVAKNLGAVFSGKGSELDSHTVIESNKLLEQVVSQPLWQQNFSCRVSLGPHRTGMALFYPGHKWDMLNSPGPAPADVMIITKMPTSHTRIQGATLQCAPGFVLREILRGFHVKNLESWYVTNLLKFSPPDGSSRIKASWLKDCLPLLAQELRIVKPKFILCLGTDASQALLGKKHTVSYMDGRVEEYSFPTAFDSKDPEGERVHTAKVVTVMHPSNIARDPSSRRQLETGVSRFVQVLRGADPSGEEDGLDHRTVNNVNDLLSLCDEIENDPEFKQSNVLAVDAEWHGEHPVNAGSYLRTIQISWLPKKAVTIHLTSVGGDVVFWSHEGKSVDAAIEILNQFIKGSDCYRKKRVVGHFFNADLEWLVHYGLDLRPEFSAPLYDFEVTADPSDRRSQFYIKKGFAPEEFVPAWYRTKYEGGADTGLMCHAIEETADYKLESLAVRYTTCPRYDSVLSDWKSEYCAENGLSSKSLGGYGMVPDDILIPYGNYDADVTLRLFFAFDVLLDKDYEGNNCREAFWESQVAAPSVLEIHQTGISVDMDRVGYLTRAFVDAKEEKELKFRELIKWPDFNFRSLTHVKEFLFGVSLNGKKSPDGGPCRQSPEDALRLNIDPLFDTSKPPKLWREIRAQGKESEHNPSTDKQTLSILSQKYTPVFAENDGATVSEFIDMIRDHRFLDQVLKTVLRPPETEEDGTFVVGDNGQPIYSEGLAGHLCDDGKVRTHIYQTKETGRWASARPNLQNISKKRDPDYKRLLGDKYSYKLRSIFKSSPGTVLLEADYIGAELFGMAIMSGDSRMVDHAKRNQLGESHEQFYDIHSNVAKMAFGLACPPTKKGMEDIGKLHLRIVAKSVIFGIAYGRGAKAIAVAAKEEKIDISQEEAQGIIDTIFNMYPGLEPFFQECQARATRQPRFEAGGRDRCHEGWLVNSFGRYRRFPPVSDTDKGLASEFGRQAMNFPIQSMIASVVSRAMAYLYELRKDYDDDLFKFVLQIHDAIVLQVPYENVKFVAEELLPFAMRNCVPIFPTDLDGKSLSNNPEYLGVEADVMTHWGEHLTAAQAVELGLPSGTAFADGTTINYTKEKA